MTDKAQSPAPNRPKAADATTATIKLTGDGLPGIEVADLSTGEHKSPPAPAGEADTAGGTATGWYLEVVQGVQAGQRYPLGESVQLGRSPEVDVPLSDGKASRAHARLDRRGDVYRLTDLNSTNGTFVNAYRITRPVFLQAGDTIRIGDTHLQIFFS